MKLDDLKYTFFGEFKDREIEKRYLDHDWRHNKRHYFISYNVCCILLLLAGLIDFKREFVWGSASLLFSMRIILVAMGIATIPLFWTKEKYHRKIDLFGFAIMLFSSIIVLLLNLMTAGKSSTMLTGILIITVSYYMFVPSLLLHALVPSVIQMISFFFYYRYEQIGLSSHIYMCFMLLAINIVMFLFRKSKNKNSRLNYLFTQYLKNENEMKDKIMAMIGHDLKTPLTVVKFRSHSIRRNLSKNNIEKAMDGVNTLELATNQLSELMQSLVEWATSHKHALNLQEKEINEVFNDAFVICDEMASLKNIKITKEIEPVNFRFDPYMVGAIIRNLVSNAVKFSEEDSTIEVKGFVQGQNYIIKIVDHGIGMDQKLIAELLSGNKIGSREGTKGESGYGLGLQLVMDFLKRHGASCEIFSETGKGTTFNLAFRT